MAEREPPEDTDDRAAGPEKTGERPPPDRGGRFRRLGRRIMGDAEGEGTTREGRTILGDAKEVFGAVLEGGDKAKSEVVRAVAREVRNYLEELGLKDDLHNLMTNYSLELHASVNLRKLAESEMAPREDRTPVEKPRRDEKGRRDESGKQDSGRKDDTGRRDDGGRKDESGE